MPHGGFDVASLSGGTIRLLQSPGQQAFQPLGVAADEDERIETIKLGEVVYQDESGIKPPVVVCRYWNHRDAEPTKIGDDHDDETRSTKDFVLFVESIDGSETGQQKLLQTAADLERAYGAVYGSGVKQSYVRLLEASLVDDAEISLDW